MDIPNPRRILVVGPPDAPILDLLQDLTGSKPTPSPNETSLAGTSHVLPIKTAYYTASIPIWIDVPEASSSADVDLSTTDTDTSPSPTNTNIDATTTYKTWSTSFLTAPSVLTALGALVICFRKPSTPASYTSIKALLSASARVVAGCRDASAAAGMGEWDGVCLAVGLRRAVVPGLEVGEEEWEEVCAGEGFEWVDGEVLGGERGGKGGRNEFGELTGIARLREALEANDWGSNEDDFGLDDFDDLEDEESMGFGAEAAELEMEMFGMKRAIYGAGDEEEEEDGEREGRTKVDEDEEDEVEKLEALMLRMQAVRDIGADMPEPERKRFAAKAVRDIMKTL